MGCAENHRLAEAEAVINDAQEAYDRLTGTTEAQTEAEAEAARQTQELQGVIESTTEQIAALTEAYNEAYGAALESISGQYDLWDEAAEVAATSAGSINSALRILRQWTWVTKRRRLAKPPSRATLTGQSK